MTAYSLFEILMMALTVLVVGGGLFISVVDWIKSFLGMSSSPSDAHIAAFRQLQHQFSDLERRVPVVEALMCRTAETRSLDDLREEILQKWNLIVSIRRRPP